MKLFIIYQLEAAICLAVFYCFYKLLLSKDANHQLKRGYIITTGFLSFLIPALTINFTINANIAYTPVTHIVRITQQFTSYTPTPQATSTLDPWQLLFWIWGIGLMAMTTRMLISLYSVNKILKESTTATNASFRITSNKIQSFSFFKAIVLNKQHFQSKAMKYILAHEQTHASQLHTLDILFVELIKSLQWFNPFAWTMAKEAMLNMEYIADNKVLTRYNDTTAYQLAIVKFSNHAGNNLLRTEFSKTNLKSRITMMNNINNQKSGGGKYILLIPVLLLLLTSFSLKIENLDISKEFSEMLPLNTEVGERILEKIPMINNLTDSRKMLDHTERRNSEKPASKINFPSEVTHKAEVQPLIDKNIALASIRTNLDLQSSLVEQDTTRIIRGRIISKDGNPASGVNVIVKGTTTGTVTNKAGDFTILVGNSYSELVIASPDNRVEVLDISEGNEFEITLRSDHLFSNLPLDESAYKLILDSTLVDDATDSRPLFIVDKKHVSNDIFLTIDPNDINTITIFKGASATKLYGNKGKNGVVLIELKKKSKKKKRTVK